MKIYLDAMGGDNAPQAPVEGALEALEQHPDLEVELSGPLEQVQPVVESVFAAMPDGVQIVVSDTGIGIAAEELPRVRQKFYQTDPSNPGSGIGLSLVDEIVRLHGGRLDIDSEPGVGTTVTVTLPAAEKEN